MTNSETGLFGRFPVLLCLIDFSACADSGCEMAAWWRVRRLVLAMGGNSRRCFGKLKIRDPYTEFSSYS